MNRIGGALALAGLGVLLAFLPFGIAGQQIGLALGAAAALLAGDARRRARARLAPDRTGPLLPAGCAAWIGALLLALLFSGRAAEGARELRKLLLLSALFLPAAAVRDRRDLRAAAELLLLAAFVAALLGLIEQARGAGNHPTRLDGPLGFYMTTSGVFLLLGLPPLALLLERERLHGLAPAAFLLLAAALLFTYTRGAWFGWAAGAAWLTARRRPRLLPAAVAAVAATMLLHPAARERLLSSFDPDFHFNRERIYLWEAGWRAFRERPLFGRGLHDLTPLIDASRDGAARERITHFHSLYLQTAVSAGAVGLAALALFATGLFAALRRAATRAEDRFGAALADGAAAALIAFLVHGLFEWNWGDSEVATALYTVIGLGLAAGGAGAAAVRSSPNRSRM
ncbi:MAG: O-antigen ligase family protein [Candidatus Eisenbacteria bacterium]|nr:O-antigen ligase family protein [Candidatus Eisenbacteria bacterium]